MLSRQELIKRLRLMGYEVEDLDDLGINVVLTGNSGKYIFLKVEWWEVEKPSMLNVIIYFMNQKIREQL